jgi:hypothetical protein
MTYSVRFDFVSLQEESTDPSMEGALLEAIDILTHYLQTDPGHLCGIVENEDTGVKAEVSVGQAQEARGVKA